MPTAPHSAESPLVRALLRGPEGAQRPPAALGFHPLSSEKNSTLILKPKNFDFQIATHNEKRYYCEDVTHVLNQKKGLVL